MAAECRVEQSWGYGGFDKPPVTKSIKLEPSVRKTRRASHIQQLNVRRLGAEVARRRGQERPPVVVAVEC